jgi:hypothetical protein
MRSNDQNGGQHRRPSGSRRDKDGYLVPPASEVVAQARARNKAEGPGEKAVRIVTRVFINPDGTVAKAEVQMDRGDVD